MNTLEFEILALLTEYPELFERNILKEEYFTNRDRIMFNILLKQYEKHKSYLTEEMYQERGFDVEYFSDLLTGNMWSSNRENKFEQLQKAIIDKYKKRRYKEIIDSYKNDYEENFNKLKELQNIDYQENSYITSNDIYETLSKKNNQIKIGYEIVDNNLNLSQNDLLILAAGTGVGKTAFALNLLSKMSKDYQCVYLNMEMSKKVLYKRLVAINTGIEIMKLNDISKLTTDEMNRVKIALEEIEQNKIILISGSVNIKNIKKNIINIKTDKPIVVFADHIGLIKSSGGSLYERMTEIAKELRTICLECNCTLIGLCQLSRESQKENKRPKLQDLRDSGEVEQSARKVLMIYNKTNNKDRNQEIEVIIAKNDDGNKIIKDFIFDRYTQRFSEEETI